MIAPAAHASKVDSELQDRVRAAVRGVTYDARADFTLAQFVEDALQRHCEHLEATYNDGDPWPHNPAPLKRGRPLTSQVTSRSPHELGGVPAVLRGTGRLPIEPQLGVIPPESPQSIGG